MEYTLISMHQQAINNYISIVCPSNNEIHQELQPSINAFKAIQSSEVRVPNVYPQANDDVIEDVPEQTNVADDTPLNVVSDKDVSTPDNDDGVFEEIIFEDNDTFFRILRLRKSLNIFQNTSSSKSHFHFGLTSSSEASD